MKHQEVVVGSIRVCRLLSVTEAPWRSWDPSALSGDLNRHTQGLSGVTLGAIFRFRILDCMTCIIFWGNSSEIKIRKHDLIIEA